MKSGEPFLLSLTEGFNLRNDLLDVAVDRASGGGEEPVKLTESKDLNNSTQPMRSHKHGQDNSQQ